MMKMGGETIQNNLIVFLIGASFSFEVIHPAQKIRHYSLFFPGRRVRAHLQNPATKCDFPIGYFIFLLTLEKCAILQFSVLSLSIRSKLPFLFHRVLVFLSGFVLCPFIY
jgi:hypothetical protein